MLTTLSSRETRIVFAIMQDLVAIEDARELRLRLGEHLLDLLDADYFASFVWTKQAGDGDTVSLNMNEGNLCNYQRHFQYCDPITPGLRNFRKAAHTDHVIARDQLVKTEFYNDFLARDGLCFGINYHAYSGAQHLGDLRIWRGRNRDTFQNRELEILNAVGRAFTSALEGRHAVEKKLRGHDPALRLQTCQDRFALTGREHQVLCLLTEGRRDLEIAEALDISVTTVRTHIRSIFQKTGAANRSALIGMAIG